MANLGMLLTILLVGGYYHDYPLVMAETIFEEPFQVKPGGEVATLQWREKYESVVRHPASKEVLQKSLDTVNIVPVPSRYLSPNITQGSIVCSFTYAAQGGTDEKWQFSLKSSDDKEKQFTCAVSRPGGTSYLFFLQFKLAVTGAQIQDVELYGEQGATLSPEEYVVNKKMNEVTHADGKFRSQLSRILIIAKYNKIHKRKQKKEL